MATEIKLPELGENITSATVVKVLVSSGDTVEADQGLLELESSKATVEMPSPQAGTIEEILVSEGDDVSVGQPVAKMSDKKGGDTKKEAPEKKSAESREEKPAAKKEPTEKNEKKQPAPSKEEEKKSEKKTAPRSEESQKTPVPAAPITRRFAREHGIELRQTQGSGPGGYVYLEDLKALVSGKQGGASSAAGPVIPPLPDFSKWGEIQVEPMSPIRRRTAEQISLSWSQVARVTHFDTADITKLEELRKQYAPRAQKTGGKLTMAVMVVKVTSLALKQFPAFNASIDVQKRQIIYKKYRNVGIAVATPRGLMVPVIKGADSKNMLEIAADVDRLAGKAREGSITLDELTGGTFTVTNIGSIGGTHFTPIVNYPEVAILGMGRAYETAKFSDGEWKPHTILPLSLSYDHRLIDGADAARFLRWVVEAIQEPLLLSLEG